MITQDQVMESAGFIACHYQQNIKTALVIGTGLGGLSKDVTHQTIIPYKAVPNFPATSVPFHAARLIIGELYGVAVLVMDGRYHFYEGLPMSIITLPVRVLHQLGIRSLIVTNAASSLKPELTPGSLAVIKDHINLMGENPLRGTGADLCPERFVDMSEPYRRQWLDKAQTIGKKLNLRLHTSIYAAISGPSLLTPAEVNMLCYLGADTVGMSTVPEVIVARQLGMNIFAISAITDSSLPEAGSPANKKQVAATAQRCRTEMSILLAHLISDITES